LAPWGYDDDDLEMALKTGAVDDLDYWKEVGYSISSKKNGESKISSSSSSRGRQLQAAKGLESSDENRPNTSIFFFNQQEHSFL
jgi:hypothetical protein